MRRPPRISTVPWAPRAHAKAWALASVGTAATAVSTRCAASGVRPHAPSHPPAAATSAKRARTSSGVSSPSQPVPKTPRTTGTRRASPGAAASTTASHSGLPRPGSSPWASTSPPTSTKTTRSHSRCAAAVAMPCSIAAGPPLTSSRTTVSSSASASRVSAKRTPLRVRVRGPARATAASRRSASSTSASDRGPGSGSTAERSHVVPPTTASRPRPRTSSAVASAPTTSPPPPMPRHRTRRERSTRASKPVRSESDADRDRVGGDRGDLLGRAVELVVGEHRRALERQLALQLEARAAPALLVPHLDRHRPRDAVGPQQDHVQRMAPLPCQPLLGVVAGPHVEGRQGVDAAAVADRVVPGDLGPRSDPDAVGLRDAAVGGDGVPGQLAVGPHALLEGAPQLGLVRLADQVGALVVEGRIEEEAVVLELEVTIGFADPALAEGEQLLTLGQSADGHGPLFERDWHREKNWSV